MQHFLVFLSGGLVQAALERDRTAGKQLFDLARVGLEQLLKPLLDLAQGLPEHDITAENQVEAFICH